MFLFESAQKAKRLIFNERPLMPGQAVSKLGKIEKPKIVDAKVTVNKGKWGFSVQFQA